MHGMEILPRHATEVVEKRLRSFRVVVVTGARQVGKSTLARLIIERNGGTYRTLDDSITLDEATRDPDGLVGGAPDGLVVIDEVQRAPDLLRAIKRVVDEDPKPGRFLLTGSANLLGMKDVVESLAGRAVYVDLLPLCWSEMRRAPRPRTLDQAFSAGSADEFAGLLARAEGGVIEATRAWALAGGMPEAHRLEAEDRRAWYESYRRTFLERDLRQLSAITSVPEFVRVMSLALLRSGGLLNKSDLASDAQVSHSTVDRYLNLLQVAYQIRLLPPYLTNVTKRLVKSPKILAVDPGAAAWAANVWAWRDAVASGRDGALLETAVLADIAAWDGLSGSSAQHFWRTGAGAEVDLVCERGDRFVAVEVKAAATLSTRAFSGLRALRADHGERFAMGVLAYLGDETRVIDDSLLAVPVPVLLGADAM